MKDILLFFWCLPQNLIGLLVFLFTKIQGAKTEVYKDSVVTRWKYSSGVSLGQFIFVPVWANEDTVKHEYGHYLQGLRLGWLYLLVIGLPSIIWAGCFRKYRQKNDISYYDLYTERWADKLGGVKRAKERIMTREEAISILTSLQSRLPQDVKEDIEEIKVAIECDEWEEDYWDEEDEEDEE